MFPGPAQRKQIDNIGQIFSGFLSTCFLGPNPSNIWMFEKWKQHCWQVFFACLFLVRSPQNKPNQLYYVAQFPMTSPPKKNYIYIYIIYIIYILYIYIILYYILYYIYIYIILYYIYIFVQFFCRRFSRDQPSKKINIFVRFFRSQPSPPNRKKKTNIHFVHFFVTDLPAASPPKNISLKNIQHIYLFQFFFRWFSRHQLSKKYKFKKNKTHLYFFSFFAADFPATSLPKNISFNKIKLIFFSFFCRRFSRDQPSKKYKF